MRYRSMHDCVKDLEAHGQLIRIEHEVDPYLEAAEIHRRVFQLGGPALLYTQLKGCRFPAVSNLFGTKERSSFLFRKTLRPVQDLVRFRSDPATILKHPGRLLCLIPSLVNALPKPSFFAPVLANETTISELPQITSWPLDGGPFITLPQVYTESPDQPHILKSNLGMYRVQLQGNEYVLNKDIGLHYQIHRGIGVHHTAAQARNEPLRVSIFIGGPPAHTFAAIMPLPEGIPEVSFAGVLAGRAFRYRDWRGYKISCDADFCVVGTIDPGRVLPEGPFGDHLGYYSLQHPFPVLNIEKVFHRNNAIWPFTIVGRPPQEDSAFGALVHDIAAPAAPKEIPGLKALHAVDAAGVHPLLLAIGSERYAPYDQVDPRPQELLTIANAILGFGQCSLAKFLLIADLADNPDIDIHDIERFFHHVLERIDLRRDLHFQTQTTIDTLDYSGHGLNQGSKVVIAARGKPKRLLGNQTPKLGDISSPFIETRLISRGILATKGPPFQNYEKAAQQFEAWAAELERIDDLKHFPLLVVVDDVDEVAASFNDFLWVTFTRSNPSHDIYGVGQSSVFKHWGCEGPLIVDARKKPRHAPALHPDPNISKKVDEIFRNDPSLKKLPSV